MPSYEVMVFGFRGTEAIAKAAADLGVVVPDLERGYMNCRRAKEIDAVLKGIHLKVLEEMAADLPGLAYNGEKPYLSFDPERLLPEYETPWGKRSVIPIQLSYCYDPDECGDDPEDAVYGVALSARYWPSLLDMHDQHGSLEGDEEYFSWADDAADWQKKAADIACRMIVEALPVFGGAKLRQKTVFA
jgi:hypothetical protein